MKTMLAVTAVLVLGTWGAGCSAANKVTEEDRVVLDHIRQIAELQSAILAGMSEGNPIPPGKFSTFVELVSDVMAGTEALQSNWGPPKEPIPYSAEAAKLARERSRQSHQVGFWGWLAGVAIGAGGIALTMARLLGRFIPGFGPVFSVVESTMGAIEGWMQKQKSEGKPDIAGGLAIALEAAHRDAKVGAWVDAKLAKVKERLGVDLTADAPPAGAQRL
jgi:hypothetical protein